MKILKSLALFVATVVAETDIELIKDPGSGSASAGQVKDYSLDGTYWVEDGTLYFKLLLKLPFFSAGTSPLFAVYLQWLDEKTAADAKKNYDVAQCELTYTSADKIDEMKAPSAVDYYIALDAKGWDGYKDALTSYAPTKGTITKDADPAD